MFKFILVTFLLSVLSPLVLSQHVLFQDIWSGGVSGAGANIGSGTAVGANLNFSLNIDPNSSIHRAYLIAASGGSNGEILLNLNGSEIIFNNETVITTGFTAYEVNAGFAQIHALDVSAYIFNSIQDFTLVVPPQSVNLNQRFHSFYLVVAYKSSNLELVNCSLLINNQSSSPVISYSIDNLNVINSVNPVGISICGYAFCNTDFDGTFVHVNATNLGLVGGNDYNAQFFCSGTQGHFYYQNGQLIGLGDDIPNETMLESDAIANIQNLIIPNSTNLNVDFIHQSNVPAYSSSNPIVCTVLTYTSPCQPFNASLLTSDTTTCSGVPVQLGASGGNTSGAFQAYEWLPQQNLSCYDCPNPIFLGDSTTNYTVRIRNTDSCSVVYPVRVRVLPNPSFESIEITESVCGGATGSIAVASSGLSQPHSYVINDGVPQNNGTFNNLAAGEYTVTLTNEHGCSVDSTVFIGEFNNVQAAFSVNPTTGTAPLDISITNQSQNATEYFWDFTDEDGNLLNQVTGHFGSAQCPVAGVYTLTLVAGNGAQHCNDTTSVLIVVKEPFVVFAYTHVTNEANLYQVFFSGVSEYDYKIYALDGKLVYKKSGSIESAGNVDLWEISKFASGMYVFRIKVKDSDGNEHEVDGKVVVVR